MFPVDSEWQKGILWEQWVGRKGIQTGKPGVRRMAGWAAAGHGTAGVLPVELMESLWN